MNVLVLLAIFLPHPSNHIRRNRKLLSNICSANVRYVPVRSDAGLWSGSGLELSRHYTSCPLGPYYRILVNVFLNPT